MIIQTLRRYGITSDLVYSAALGSILLSLAMWFIPRSASGDEGRPERLAIFVGLWPPTLALFAHALREDEQRSNDEDTD